MPITFSSSDRLAITRRQLKIELENSGFQSSINSFTSQANQLLQVDNGNAKFYDFYNSIVNSYETESQQMNGNVAAEYTGGDLDAAAQTPSIAPFFPTTGTSAYTRNLPLIQDGSFTNNTVKGFFYPSSTDSRYEQNILNNAIVSQGLEQMIFRLQNGISGSSSATTTDSTSIPAGSITNFTIDVSSTSGFSVNDLIYINNGSASGIYQINTIINIMMPLTTQFTISSIIPTQMGISAGATIKNTVSAFTPTELQNLSSVNYQEILNNITNGINSLILEWQGKISSQITALSGNQDDRSPFVTQNSSALSAVNNTNSIINTWIALSNTGINGKYVSSSIAPISSELSNRLSTIPNRITEIGGALGNSGSDALIQSGDTFSTNVANNPYYNRYTWLNFRINRASGSLRRYYAANQSQGVVQQLLNDNNSIKSQYNSYFNTKAITFIDGSNIIHVKDTIGLSTGDSITTVSETQPEIQRTVLDILGTTQLKLDLAIPNTYLVSDLARIFKML